MSGTVQTITDFEEDFHLTYPHNNSFLNGGAALVLGRRSKGKVSLWQLDPVKGTRFQLCEFALEKQPERMLWSDTALLTSRSVTVADNQLWLLPGGKGDGLGVLYSPPPEHRLHPIPALSADGRYCLVALYGPSTYACLKIDLEDRSTDQLFVKDWWVDHFHFCPHDPSWIGFSHEGLCSKVMDRVCGWHRNLAPDGLCCFEQYPEDTNRVLYAGHERWSFHDRSVMVIAYGEGPGSPRGVYEAFVDGRPQRLISEGNRDFHLDVSRDGRWIVVDTTGKHDLPGKGWEGAEMDSDIVVLDRATGERRFAAASRMSRHPSHPHPVFSPDGEWVYFNETNEPGLLNRVCKVRNPFI